MHDSEGSKDQMRQMEPERQHRVDEARSKNEEKRRAVEERKRLIWEAEQGRKEAMVRRNLDRESTMDAAKRTGHQTQRNLSSFVFGSSTPRDMNLNAATLVAMRGSGTTVLSVHPPTSHGGGTTVVAEPQRRPVSLIYPNERRAFEGDVISHGNYDSMMRQNNDFRRILSSSDQARACLMMTPLSEISSTNGIGTDRYSITGDPMAQSLVMLPRRRHPELHPVAPRERDFGPPSSSIGKSRDPESSIFGVKQGPKRAISMSRLDQLAKPRQRYVQETLKNRASSRENTLFSPTVPVSSLSGASSPSSGLAPTVPMRQRRTPRKPRPMSIAVIPNTAGTQMKKSPSRDLIAQKKMTEPVPALRPSRARSTGSSSRQPFSLPESKQNKISSLDKPMTAEKPTPPNKSVQLKTTSSTAKKAPKNVVQKSVTDENLASCGSDDVNSRSNNNETAFLQKGSTPDVAGDDENSSNGKKDVSVEEYKRLLAEKRKMARERAEKEAEIERLRLEEEKRQEELERVREEEEQRRMEEEAMHLATEHRKGEELKLQRAIEEQCLREKEEQKRLEEESRLKAEKDEEEAKAKEEAEKARLELQERLKKDEEERIARKKRIDAIMTRTRKTPGKGTSPNSEGSRTPELQSTESSPYKSQELKTELDNETLMSKMRDEEMCVTTPNGEDTGVQNQYITDENTDDSQDIQNHNHSSHVNGVNNREQGSADALEATVENLLDLNIVNLNSDNSSISSLNPSKGDVQDSNYENVTGSLIASEQLLDIQSNPSCTMIKEDNVNGNRNNTFDVFENQSQQFSQDQMTDLLS